MDNNMFNQYQQAPKQPSNNNLLGLLGLILSGIGFVMVLFGTIFTCTCSAKKSFAEGSDGYSISAIFILTIFGVIFAVAGLVLALVDFKSKSAGIISKITVPLAVFSILFGLLPMFTICGYNCSLNNAVEDASNFDYSSIDYSDLLDGLY